MTTSRGAAWLAALALALALPAGCGKRPGPPAAGGTTMATMTLGSAVFSDGAAIPRRHADEGEDRSPPLQWSGAPAGTVTFALVCDDPDAPTAEPWVHWLIWDIPAGVTALPEGVPGDPRPAQPAGAAQGTNSWGRGNLGYRGPAPPRGSGAHRYRFRLYALDAALELEPGATRAALRAAMEGHVLAEAELGGTYERR